MEKLQAQIQSAIDASGAEMGVALIHVESGDALHINADAGFPMASVLKIPVLCEAFHQMAAGAFALDDRWELTYPLKNIGSGILTYLNNGLQPTVRDLLTLMIIISDNTATNRCIDAAGGFAAVTARMRDLGLRQTELNRYTIGRIPDDPNFKENITSARDLATLLELVWTRRAARDETCAAILDVLGRQQLRQRLPRWYPDTVKHFGKTGTTANPREGWAARNDSSLLSTPNGTVAMACLVRYDSNAVDGYAVDEGIGRVGAAVLDALGVEHRFPTA